MATSAIKALATITLGSAQATVTFSSISAGYRDLRLIINATGSHNIWPIFNNDTAGNYHGVFMGGNGSATQSFATSGSSSLLINGNGSLNTTPAIIIFDLLDYSAGDKHKIFLSRFDNSSNYTNAYAGRWASTATVSTITMQAAVSWSAGSTFTLYGVSA